MRKKLLIAFLVLDLALIFGGALLAETNQIGALGLIGLAYFSMYKTGTFEII